MLCLNNSGCLNGTLCQLNIYVCHNQSEIQRSKENFSVVALTLPMIQALYYELPSFRYIYLSLFSIIVAIGFISNILSLTTFVRDRIRYTIIGIYLICFSITGLFLMLLMTMNIFGLLLRDHYLFHVWTCFCYPYLSRVTVYAGILLSTAIAIENVGDRCYNWDKFRVSHVPILISIVCLVLPLMTNLDKVFARYLQIDTFGRLYCAHLPQYHEFWLHINIFELDMFIIIPCLLHWLCLFWIFSMRTGETCLVKFCANRQYFIPCLIITSCFLWYSVYRNLLHFYFLYPSEFIIHVHLVFMFLLYAPQIFTYWIYVSPNDFYIREFYQIWLYRKLCCCFYKRQRHVQRFQTIHLLWPRRSSVEAVKTVTCLDDIYDASELYKKYKVET